MTALQVLAQEPEQRRSDKGGATPQKSAEMKAREPKASRGPLEPIVRSADRQGSDAKVLHLLRGVQDGLVLGGTEDVVVAYRKDHVLVKLRDRVILSLRGGGVQTSPLAHLRPRWLVNFAVDDVERAVSAALSAGGARPQPSPASWAPAGFSRTLQDPDGGLFTLSPRDR